MKNILRALRIVPITSLLLFAHPVAGLELTWPAGATQVLAQRDSVADFLIATGPAEAGGRPPTRALDGVLLQEIWRLPGATGDIARLVADLRAQLTAQGYEITFACADRACGGFDFRFALPIAPAPEMFVDLGNFHYLAARRMAPAEDLALTISAGGQAGYVHIARVGAGAGAQTPLVAVIAAPPAAEQAALIAELAATGHAVLEDLEFETGASALSGDRYLDLVSLAGWLAAEPGRKIALVGHTDATGALDRNIALSEARAAAVRQSLITDYGVSPAQVSAAGVGYLAPRATNATPEGREANRRVEVVLISQ
jgi:outer membrane protein OmpA-like peptidoglycan-associated protein